MFGVIGAGRWLRRSDAFMPDSRPLTIAAMDDDGIADLPFRHVWRDNAAGAIRLSAYAPMQVTDRDRCRWRTSRL